jgi:hypothetical protein
MFKLGEYDEDEARDIADYLKDAGMKVDIRTSSYSSLEVFHFLEGRMSEIKNEIDEEKFNRYARFLDAMRKVLAAGATSEDFRERLHIELDPQIIEKRKLFCDYMEGNVSNVSKEELEASISDSYKLMENFIEVSSAESFIDLVLERNEIEIGEFVGNTLDDPIIRIFAHEDKDEDSKFHRTTTSFTVEPIAEVYVDEFSALFSDEVDVEFKKEYPEDYARLSFLGRLIAKLMEPSPGKIDMEAFSEKCELQMESNGNLLELSGKRAAEELARSLEKNDIIKIKGGTIKWKR